MRGKEEDGIFSTADQVRTLRDGKVASLDAYLDSESAIRGSGSVLP